MRIQTALVVACSLCLALPALGQIPADLEVNSIVGSSSVSAPLSVRHAGDGSGRLFIAERSGLIKVFKPGSDPGTGTDILPTPFLDLGDDGEGEVDVFFEGGLLGLAFHPDYENNGYFYVSYTRDGSPLETVIRRYEVSAGDPDVADATSEVEIFSLAQPAGNHNGGDLHFGPNDGYLYLSLGDGGSSASTSQNNNTLLGNIIRIDPCDTSTCTTGYTIPADNPFAMSAGADEIWSYGLRNPYRFSFDRNTGDMFIGDVGSFGGQRTEEVNFHANGDNSGVNFGWNCEEGAFGDCMASPAAVRPILSHTDSAGDCAISGGYRYRGCIQGLQGMYLWGDSCSGQIRFGTQDGMGNWSAEVPAAWNLAATAGFGEDEAGELYLLTFSDVLRFESDSECVTGALFGDGFESGNVSSWTSSNP